MTVADKVRERQAQAAAEEAKVAAEKAERERRRQEEEERNLERTKELVGVLKGECEGVGDVNLIGNISHHVNRREERIGWVGVSSNIDGRLRCLARYSGDHIYAYGVRPMIGSPSQTYCSSSNLTLKEFLDEFLSEQLAKVW